MARNFGRATVRGLSLMLLLVVGSQVSGGQTVTPVAKLDFDRFTGHWYEIARLPSKRAKKCVRDSVSLVSPGDKKTQLQFVNSCLTKPGYADVSNVNVKAQDKSGDGKLKFGPFWPFYKKYWVLAVEPEYEWALMGSPNHKDLWVLSRAAIMTPEVLNGIEATAAGEGYATSKMVMIPQSARYELK